MHYGWPLLRNLTLLSILTQWYGNNGKFRHNIQPASFFPPFIIPCHTGWAHIRLSDAAFSSPGGAAVLTGGIRQQEGPVCCGLSREGGIFPPKASLKSSVPAQKDATKGGGAASRHSRMRNSHTAQEISLESWRKLGCLGMDFAFSLSSAAFLLTLLHFFPFSVCWALMACLGGFLY